MIVHLMLTFMQVGALSVGGGYAAIPLIESLVVRINGWLTPGEFGDLVTIAEMTPGPIAINAATFVGMRMAGLAGGVAATLGCIAPSLALVSLLSVAYMKTRGGGLMGQILACLRAVMTALIASAALSLLRAAALDTQGALIVPGAVMALVALALLRTKKCSPVQVMLGCGLCGVALHAAGLW